MTHLLGTAFQERLKMGPTLLIAHECCACHPNHKERKEREMAVTVKVAVTHAPAHHMLPARPPFNPASSCSGNWSTELASCREALSPYPSSPLMLGDIGWESQNSLSVSIVICGAYLLNERGGEGRGGSVSKGPLAAREAGMLAKP